MKRDKGRGTRDREEEHFDFAQCDPTFRLSGVEAR